MDHLRYIKRGTKAVGEHFDNGNKYDSKYLVVKVIEKVTPKSEALRLQREKCWMNANPVNRACSGIGVR